MNYDTVPTIVAGVVCIFGIFGATLYSVIKILVTGRSAMFDRKPEHKPEADAISSFRRSER